MLANEHLTGVQTNDPRQLQLLLRDFEALRPARGVPLRQLPALLVLDGGEQAQGTVLPCITMGLG